MPITREQINTIYESATASAPKSKESLPVSNIELIKKLEHKTDPLRLTASVFLRPASALRYNLLPALAAKLAYQKPVEGSRAQPCKTPEEGIVRSLSLLLELADPAWTELPDSWISLGSVLNNRDLVLAREFLDTILASTRVEKPMEALRKLCSTEKDDTGWVRYYRLSPDEFKYFDSEEVAEALKKIAEADQDQ